MGEEYPDELTDVLKSFEMARCKINDVIRPLQNSPRSELIRTMKPLEIAKLDLVTAYTTNSLYWAYLATQGINPKTHTVKQELDRIRTYMGKIKEIEDRKNAPKLEKQAVKRFIKHAMFDHNKATDKNIADEKDAAKAKKVKAEVKEETNKPTKITTKKTFSKSKSKHSAKKKSKH